MRRIFSYTILGGMRTLARASNTWRIYELAYERLLRTAVLRVFSSEARLSIHTIPTISKRATIKNKNKKGTYFSSRDACILN